MPCQATLYSYEEAGTIFQVNDTKKWCWRYLKCVQGPARACNDRFVAINVGNNTFITNNYYISVNLPSSDSLPTVSINNRKIDLSTGQSADISTIGWNLTYLPAGICPDSRQALSHYIPSSPQGSNVSGTSFNPTQQFLLYSLVAIIAFFLIIAVISRLNTRRR